MATPARTARKPASAGEARKHSRPRRRAPSKRRLPVRRPARPAMRAVKQSLPRLPASRDQWEKLYASRSLGAIPWNTDAPAKELGKFLETGVVQRGRALEVGCGTGANSISLARKGFQVIGIDASPSAISLAKENAKRARVHCIFWVGDALHLTFPDGYFDFVFDRGCFSLLPPPAQKQFVESVSRVLAPGGWYQLICPSGTLTKQQLQSRFSPRFSVQDVVETADVNRREKRISRFTVAVLERTGR